MYLKIDKANESIAYFKWEVTNIINTLHQSTQSSDELTKLIDTQTKLLEGLKYIQNI